MRKEIVLPAHLYDRIRASAGEHGGVGRDAFFGENGVPQCAHGHAWGTRERMKTYCAERGLPYDYIEPELGKQLQWFENDAALGEAGFGYGCRVPFDPWCELLNVKRGPDPVSPKVEATEEVEQYA